MLTVGRNGTAPEMGLTFGMAMFYKWGRDVMLKFIREKAYFLGYN